MLKMDWYLEVRLGVSGAPAGGGGGGVDGGGEYE